MNKKRKVLLVVIGIFILSLSIISTIAFFTAQIVGNPTNNNARVNMNDLKLTFSDQTGLVEGNGITPGWTHQKTVTVENTGTASVTYDLVWLNVENEITNDEMVYSITCTSNCNGLEETAIPSLGEKLKIVTNTIDKDETQVYTITFTFKELNSPQDYNQNKNFSGNIGILESGTYEEKYIGTVLTDWQYTLDDTNHIISLTRYIGTNPNVNVYPYYRINNTEYSTIMYDSNPGTGVFVRNSNIESVTFLGNVEFRNNTMMALFSGCEELQSVDISKLDTSNITSMIYMFTACSQLTQIKGLNKINTSSVMDIGFMFTGCSSLTNLDLSNFNTQSVTNMGFMFSGCSSLTNLDLSNFNTQSVTTMYNMFQNCSSLTTIYINNTFVVTNVSDSSGMFSGCTSLVGGNGTTYDSNKVDKTYAVIDAAGTPGYFTAKA